jgi:hypothetical protein
MTTAPELQKTIIDLADGRDCLDKIQYRIYEVVRQMSRTRNNETWKALSDKHYELKKSRRNIQNQMGKLVAERMK